MIRPRHHCGVPVFRDRLLDSAVVGGDDDFLRTGLARAIGDVNHHRLAGDIRKRLAGQARRGIAGRDDDDEGEHVTGD
jgi:hypothetical protein